MKLISKLSLMVVVVMMVGDVCFAQSAKTETKPETKTVVFIGDSITEGYGVKKEQAFPEIAGQLLRKKGYDVKIVNGGISGSVSAEADRRVKWFLKAKPDIVVLELGGNDALKGTPAGVIEKNLDSAIALAKANRVQVLLVGMKIYTNFGPAYSKEFEALFPRLANKHGVPLLPFLLEDVALKKELNQSDMKHPNVEGHAIVAKRVANHLEKLL